MSFLLGKLREGVRKGAGEGRRERRKMWRNRRGRRNRRRSRKKERRKTDRQTDRQNKKFLFKKLKFYFYFLWKQVIKFLTMLDAAKEIQARN